MDAVSCTAASDLKPSAKTMLLAHSSNNEDGLRSRGRFIHRGTSVNPSRTFVKSF
jgi:hypothetical protein